MQEMNRTGNSIEVTVYEIFNKLRSHRKLVIKVALIFFVLGIVVAFLLPRSYQAKAVLLPELSKAKENQASGLLKRFSSMSGLDLGGAANSYMDPMLYPEIIKSKPFLLSLMHEPVYFSSIDSVVTPYLYYTEIKKPSAGEVILGYTIGLPSRIKKIFTGTAPASRGNSARLNGDTAIVLDLEQEEVLGILAENMEVSLDENTGLATVRIEMPDPYAATVLTKKSVEYLTLYITDYKTEKAIQDMEFVEKRYAEAKIKFEEAQERLASFRDKNRHLATEVAEMREQRYVADHNLHFGVFQNLAERLEQSRIEVQHVTPVFKVLEPPVLPNNNSGPSRAMVVLSFTLAGLVIAVLYIYLKAFYLNTKESGK